MWGIYLFLCLSQVKGQYFRDKDEWYYPDDAFYYVYNDEIITDGDYYQEVVKAAGKLTQSLLLVN